MSELLELVAPLAPYKGHKLYAAAVRKVIEAKDAVGPTEAKALVGRLTDAFEEVALRDVANRLRLSMEEAPGFPNPEIR